MKGDWPWKRLGDLTENFDSARVPVREADRRPGPYPYYGASGVVDHVDEFLFDGEFLLIAEDGENLRTRNTPVAFIARGKFWVNNHVHIVRANSEADTRFLLYALTATDYRGYLTGSTMPKLTQGNMNRILLPVPPLSEQRAIANILGALDDKIELNRRMSETLEAIARALFKSWFVDFDPEPNEKDDKVPLDELVDINPPRPLRTGATAPYLDMANMPTRGHSALDIVSRPFTSGSRFINGDTLLARITPCLENGKTALVDFLNPGDVGWGSTEYIVLRPIKPLPEEYAYCLARSEEFREFAIQSMTGSSGRQRVPTDALRRYRLNRPDPEIAKRFAHVVRPLFERAHLAMDDSRTLVAVRNALLPQFMSGELRVRT